MRAQLKAIIDRAVTGYSETSYWKMRFALYDPDLPKILRCWYYCRLRRMEVRNNAMMGTQPDGGSKFAGKPILPHGLWDIGITAYAVIGKDVIILPRVSIGIKGYGRREAPRIGDHVYIGLGATIIGNVTIGDNAVIGANTVVTKDVPSGFTAVGNPARLIPPDKPV